MSRRLSSCLRNNFWNIFEMFGHSFALALITAEYSKMHMRGLSCSKSDQSFWICNAQVTHVRHAMHSEYETTSSLSKIRCEFTDACRKQSKLLHTLLAKRICKRS